MNATDQAAGEQRVQDMLVRPLEEMGLGRPTTILKPDWEQSKRSMCQRLAYLSDNGLIELREWVEAHPAGPGKDRFPIPLKITRKAAEIEPPNVGPSPYILKIFGSDLGLSALDGGWAPELLGLVRKERGKWPGAWTISGLKSAADDPIRRLEDVELRLSRGEDISDEDRKFRDGRRQVIAECQGIRDQAKSGGRQ